MLCKNVIHSGQPAATNATTSSTPPIARASIIRLAARHEDL